MDKMAYQDIHSCYKNEFTANILFIISRYTLVLHIKIDIRHVKLIFKSFVMFKKMSFVIIKTNGSKLTSKVLKCLYSILMCSRLLKRLKAVQWKSAEAACFSCTRNAFSLHISLLIFTLSLSLSLSLKLPLYIWRYILFAFD